jgi:hypothetical protein
VFKSKRYKDKGQAMEFWRLLTAWISARNADMQLNF